MAIKNKIFQLISFFKEQNNILSNTSEINSASIIASKIKGK